MDLLFPEIWGISESLHCSESARKWFLLGISVHALIADELDFKDLKTILKVWRFCVKVGKGSAYDCCHLDVPPRKCKWSGIGGF